MPQSNEEKLREQYHEIAVLAGRLAHEIRNPLSTIGLNIELLAEDFADPQSPRERRALNRTQTVARECARLQELLDGFLSFARAKPARMEVCDLNSLVEDLLDFYRPRAREAGIEVVRLLDRNLPGVKIDREQIRAALWNLVINAQQAMPEGGTLEVRTRATESGAALDLIDTGAGMDETTRSQCFHTFFSTKTGGTGLGLPTTRKIVEAHQGTIDVESEPGRGTKFTIELPASPWPVATTQPP